MNRNRWILVGFCGVMVLSALMSALRRREHEPEKRVPVTVPESRFAPRQLPITGTNPAREYSNALADAVQKVMPSVVVIRTEKVLYKDMRDFFGFIHRVPEQLAGEGSGVIIDERGYVITSWHVIKDAKWVEVVLNEGTKYPVDLVGVDASTDLAILKIKVPGADGQNGNASDSDVIFPVAEFGNSDALRVGEVVIAIGSPFSLQGSVTVGHVSQKGRRVQILPYEDFIQTDAAINEGNSGGPLIDVDGRLIGINAAIQTEASKKGVGIAFAVPSNLAQVIAQSLIEKHKHEWPWVGAAFGKYGPGAPELQVTQVWRNTPAALSGIQPGDVVKAVNGIEVQDEFDILRVIFNHAVGDKVRFSIERDKEKQLEIELLLEEFPGIPTSP